MCRLSSRPNLETRIFRIERLTGTGKGEESR